MTETAKTERNAVAEITKPTTRKRATPAKTEQTEGAIDVSSMNIDERLFNIQQEADAIGKNADSYNYKYADYYAVWDTMAKPLCKKYKVAYTTTAHMGASVKTEHAELPTLLLACTVSAIGYDGPLDGCYRSFDIAIPLVGGDDPQKEVGKSITYYRRYGLMSLLGLSVYKDAEDVDAKQPQPRKPKAGYPQPELNKNMQHNDKEITF